MKKDVIISNIILELNKDMENGGDGLSSWKVFKLMRIRDKTVLHKNIDYWLKKYHQLKLLKKKETKYRLKGFVSFNNDGSIIVANPPAVLMCPFLGDSCDCKEGFSKDCKYFKSMPEYFQELFLKHKKEKC